MGKAEPGRCGGGPDVSQVTGASGGGITAPTAEATARQAEACREPAERGQVSGRAPDLRPKPGVNSGGYSGESIGDGSTGVRMGVKEGHSESRLLPDAFLVSEDTQGQDSIL